MTNDDIPDALAHVVDSMLARGCPCRFPRFRATCERDTKEVAVPGYTTWEQLLLVDLFETKVPHTDIRREGQWRKMGRCAVCGSSYVRTSEELFRDAWLERLEIKPVMPELGASLHTPLPHCCEFFAAGPQGRRDDVHLLQLSYPHLSVDAWLAWLAA